MFYWILKILFGPLARMIWIKKVEGEKNVPKKGACIIAANHSSYFDFISLISIYPRRIYFLAAEKFFKSKFWRPLVNLTSQIKVERENKDKGEVYDLAYLVLKKGKVLGIFPEGTRSSNGEIQKAFTGVAKFALTAKAPVIPVGIQGAYEVMTRFDKFPKFKKIIKIKIGEPMYFEEYYGRENDEEILREITNRIMLKIAELAGKEYRYL
jgi:1-acyl-sn-glycerol-3-phosphate acyltransferase